WFYDADPYVVAERRCCPWLYEFPACGAAAVSKGQRRYQHSRGCQKMASGRCCLRWNSLHPQEPGGRHLRIPGCHARSLERQACSAFRHCRARPGRLVQRRADSREFKATSSIISLTERSRMNRRTFMKQAGASLLAASVVKGSTASSFQERSHNSCRAGVQAVCCSH